MKRFLFAFLLIHFLSNATQAQISPKEIDAVVEKTMQTFDVPGIAVAIVKDNQVWFSKGYGVSSLKTGKKMDDHTRFGIASNSKAFTTTALGILVDEGKIKWQTLVTDIIPEFKLYAPYVTENFMIEDLLCHRSGLGLGAGDLMFWPGKPLFSKADIIHNLRFLKPVSQFRTKYDYDNLLYMVAGEVIERVSGMSWEDFVEKRIMQPLRMNESAAAYSRLTSKENVIDPHAPVEGKVVAIKRELNDNLNAAGGIYSSVLDMAKWAVMQLNNGKYTSAGGEKSIISAKVHNDLWTIHTPIPIRGTTMYQSNFSGYGLGWRLTDEMGHKVVSHTGGLAGIVTQFTLIPDLNLGIIVFTNQQSGAAFQSITSTIKDAFYGIKGEDRVAYYAKQVQQSRERAAAIVDKINEEIKANEGGQVDLKQFTGTYSDDWFGKIDISEKEGHLYFSSEKSPLLHGQMNYYKAGTFVVRWEYRSMDADAFVKFGFDFDGKPSTITMKPISPLTDFSFDFQDLYFNRVD